MTHKHEVSIFIEQNTDIQDNIIFKRLAQHISKLNAKVTFYQSKMHFERSAFHSNLGSSNRSSFFILNKGYIEVKVTKTTILITTILIVDNLVFLSCLLGVFLSLLLAMEFNYFVFIIIPFFCASLTYFIGLYLNKAKITRIIHSCLNEKN